jgi:hypothetical protein
MMRELIEKEAAAVKGAVHAVREWLHPTMAMKGHAFDRPLDDLGQPIDEVEQDPVKAQEKGAGRA